MLSSAQRSPLLPGVPSASEAGLPGFEASGWFGLVLPKGASPQLVEQLSAAIAAIAQAPQTAERFAQNGISVEHSTPAGFAKLIADDGARWGEVIRAGNITLE